MDQKLTSFQLAHYKAFGFIQLKGVLKEIELKAIMKLIKNNKNVKIKETPLQFQIYLLHPKFFCN